MSFFYPFPSLSRAPTDISWRLATNSVQEQDAFFFSVDLNGSVIILKSFGGGRDIGHGLIQPLDLAGEVTEA